MGSSLGYAFLTQDLTINGVSKVQGNDYSIHFDNLNVSSGSVTLSEGDSAATIDSSDDLTVNYTITLKHSKPISSDNPHPGVEPIDNPFEPSPEPGLN